MEFETVFEISKHPFPFSFFVPAMMLFGGIALLRQKFVKYREAGKLLTRNIVTLVLISLLDAAIAVILICSICSSEDSEHGYASKYYAGEYEIVEGDLVIDETANSGIAAFSVNGEEFSFSYLLRNPLPEHGYARAYFIEHDGEKELVRLDIAK